MYLNKSFRRSFTHDWFDLICFCFCCIKEGHVLGKPDRSTSWKPKFLQSRAEVPYSCRRPWSLWSWWNRFGRCRSRWRVARTQPVIKFKNNSMTKTTNEWFRLFLQESCTIHIWYVPLLHSMQNCSAYRAYFSNTQGRSLERPCIVLNVFSSVHIA